MADSRRREGSRVQPRREPSRPRSGRRGGQFGEQSFPGRGVVDRFPLSGLTIAVDSLKHVEQRPDRSEVARVDRLGGEGLRAFEPNELKQRMIRRVVELLPPRGVSHDLADAPFAHPSPQSARETALSSRTK